MPHVAHDADHREPRRAQSRGRQPKPPSDRVLPRPKAPGGAPADHRHRERALAVQARKGSSRGDGNRHRPKIIFARHSHFAQQRLVGRRERLSFDADWAGAALGERGEVADHGCGLDLGKRADPAQRLLIERHNLMALAVLRLRQRHTEAEHAARIKSLIHRCEIAKSRRHECRADEQQEREPDLRQTSADRNRPPETTVPRPPCLTVCWRFAEKAWPDAGNMNTIPVTKAAAQAIPSIRTFNPELASPGRWRATSCGRFALISARPQAASGRPSAVPSSDSSSPSVKSCRAIRARLAPSAARSAISRRRAAPRASCRFATFAQARSSRKPTATVTHRHEPPRVGALNIAQEQHAHAAPGVRERIFDCQARADVPHLRLGLPQRHTWFQPRNYAQVAPDPFARLARLLQPKRPCVGAHRKVEFLRHHAHDGVGEAVQHESSAQNLRIGAQPLLPESVADHQLVPLVRALTGKKPALDRGHAQQGKETCRHKVAVDRLRLVRAGQRRVPGAVGRHLAGDVIAFEPVEVVTRGKQRNDRR